MVKWGWTKTEFSSRFKLAPASWWVWPSICFESEPLLWRSPFLSLKEQGCVAWHQPPPTLQKSPAAKKTDQSGKREEKYRDYLKTSQKSTASFHEFPAGWIRFKLIKLAVLYWGRTIVWVTPKNLVQNILPLNPIKWKFYKQFIIQ